MSLQYKQRMFRIINNFVSQLHSDLSSGKNIFEDGEQGFTFYHSYPFG